MLKHAKTRTYFVDSQDTTTGQEPDLIKLYRGASDYVTQDACGFRDVWDLEN